MSGNANKNLGALVVASTSGSSRRTLATVRVLRRSPRTQGIMTECSFGEPEKRGDE